MKAARITTVRLRFMGMRVKARSEKREARSEKREARSEKREARNEKHGVAQVSLLAWVSQVARRSAAGSAASRRASPSTFTATTVSKIRSPGYTASHGEAYRYVCAF